MQDVPCHASDNYSDNSLTNQGSAVFLHHLLVSAQLVAPSWYKNECQVLFKMEKEKREWSHSEPYHAVEKRLNLIVFNQSFNSHQPSKNMEHNLCFYLANSRKPIYIMFTVIKENIHCEEAGTSEFLD